ncbi:Hypothetical protein SRAE_X000208200 [Strongyloides ratti]|uniref:Uncharacterized protein n=1 Tax=Strongyloides ratti TaxID=34506 RepID=A0A090KYQ0_STRRB|nr:Hypothetical protein SRAE_X000208200 [Strongyloides ratti]CEF60344.1 Hypothetical protein SRAE_X000208200 [Strongyloides ratti]
MIMSIKFSPIFFLLFININYVFLYDANRNKGDIKIIYISQWNIKIIKDLFRYNDADHMDISNKMIHIPFHNMERRNIRRYGCRFKFCRIIESV